MVGVSFPKNVAQRPAKETVVGDVIELIEWVIVAELIATIVSGVGRIIPRWPIKADTLTQTGAFFNQIIQLELMVG